LVVVDDECDKVGTERVRAGHVQRVKAAQPGTWSSLASSTTDPGEGHEVELPEQRSRVREGGGVEESTGRQYLDLGQLAAHGR